MKIFISFTRFCPNSVEWGLLLWIRISYFEFHQNKKRKMFCHRRVPPLDFPRYLKNCNIFSGRRWKIFFRTFSDPLYYRDSKNTNLTYGEFLKGKLVASLWWILGRLKLCYIKDIYYLLDSFSPQENWLVQAGNKGPTVEHLKLFLSSLLKCCVVNALNSLTLILKV